MISFQLKEDIQFRLGRAIRIASGSPWLIACLECGTLSDTDLCLDCRGRREADIEEGIEAKTREDFDQ